MHERLGKCDVEDCPKCVREECQTAIPPKLPTTPEEWDKLREAKAEIERLKKTNSHLLGKDTLISSGELPNALPARHHVNITIEDLKRYNATLSEVGNFIADMLGVSYEKLCVGDMMFRRDALTAEKEMSRRLAEAKSCNCGDVGFFIYVPYSDAEPKQEQCEFCYTDPNSRFNALAAYDKHKGG